LSRHKAVNNRDKNFTLAKVERRRKQLEESVARYLTQLDTADLQEPSETITLTKTRLKEKLAKLDEEMTRLAAIEKQMLSLPDRQISLTDPDSRSMATSGRGFRRRRLQCADGGRYREPSDRHTRSNEYGLGSLTTCERGEGCKGGAACGKARCGR